MNLYDFGEGLHHLVDLEMLPPNPFVIDAGACIGDFCIAMNKLRPDCEILAIEPSRRNMAQLKDAVKDMPNVTIIESALSDSNSEIKMYDAYGVDNKFYQWGSTKKGLANKASFRREFERMDEYMVGTTTLESLMNGRKVDYLKMDIEGSELEVICSMPQSIADKIMQISLENHYLDSDMIENALRNLGFNIHCKEGEIYGYR
jgi:FkbM family methyltransferase